jgi:catechol 2,3-dioxygenase-like lactoylglutathione lyase family enzyme
MKIGKISSLLSGLTMLVLNFIQYQQKVCCKQRPSHQSQVKMKITELIMQTTDTDRLARFYAEVLELAVQKDEQGFHMRTGSTHIVFTGPTSMPDPFYHFAFTIPANQVEEAREWLQHKVALLWIADYQGNIAEFVNWNARSLYFLDPAGNILELIARFDLNNASGNSFGPQSLLSVSEIGLVFPAPDFEQNITGLLQNHGLHYFSKQPPLPHFRAIGNDEGLLITVPENRMWYPTQKPSVLAPLQVRFSNNDKEHTLVF